MSSESPFPDIHELFNNYNDCLFNGKLSSVYVEWSKRMTLCAGVCSYHAKGGCNIKLSGPLLKFRPVSDLENTLLHECIHAFLFITESNEDRGDHGPQFCAEMERVNKIMNSNVTIYHDFHDEVDHYRNHWWECIMCHHEVKRSMNRPPGKHDFWYATHLKECGGDFIKTKEPVEYRKRIDEKRSRSQKNFEKRSKTKTAAKKAPTKKASSILSLMKKCSSGTRNNAIML